MKSLFFLLLTFISIDSFCQNEKYAFTKFGKVSVTDLQTKIYPVDSNANAVILSDIGSTAVEGNSKSSFSLVSKRHKVVHILNKNGYEEASVKIPLYIDGRNEETISGLKATTYNLENGKIIETKLEKSEQFKEKVDKNRQFIKFTMPQVKAGSIIEYEYEVNSDFISVLDPWYFQSLTAPTLWSEFTLSVPQFFTYNFFSRSYYPFLLNEHKDRKGNFSISNSADGVRTENVNFTAGITDYRWALQNVPELKEESFTSSMRNNISRMEFQLASQNDPLVPHSFRSTWKEVIEGLLASESFGMKLNTNNNWMSDVVNPLYRDINNNTKKVRKIFTYVRDNFTCTGNDGIYMDQGLKNVFKTKKGNVAEINLLLTAMLKFAGLDASPVLVSTTSHGYVYEASPMINSFNYVVVRYVDGKETYYLDASDPRLGFNKLPVYCYNGNALIVNDKATPAYFIADSLKEIKKTSYYFSNSENGKWGGTFSQTPGFYESYNIRNAVNDKSEEEFFKEVQKKYSAGAKIEEASIDSLSNYEVPVGIKYKIEFKRNDEDVLYINPTFGEGYKKNPFVATERDYPVEMPYASDETIYGTLEVPDGYVVDELPGQVMVKLNEGGKSYFEYRISQSGNLISFLTKIKLNRAFFKPEEYPALREFFNLVVKKQSEQIVLKKKK